MRPDCFSYRKEKIKKDGFEWFREFCDCSERKDCDKCTLYKPADAVKMVVVNKLITYEDLKQ